MGSIPTAHVPRPIAGRKNIIIDTDMFSDVDNVGALMLAATSSHVKLLAVMMNSHSVYSALAASALLGHYGRSNVPIAIRRPMDTTKFVDNITYANGEYASKVANSWHGGSLAGVNLLDAWEPVALYRKILSDAPIHSVTIVSIGTLHNLADLLKSRSDQYSLQFGKVLTLTKVAEVVIKGGWYPSGHEPNFWNSRNDGVAALVVNQWFRRMVFLGQEVGRAVRSGSRLMHEGPPNDPTRMAYIWHGLGTYAPRSSSDPLTMLYAINGLGTMFRFGNAFGFNSVDEDGKNKWVNERREGLNHFFLQLTVDTTVAAGVLDALFMEGAAKANYNLAGYG